MLTIHMTTFNRHGSGLLQAAVQSVLSQDFTDFEFIVHDDASYDGTAGYLDDVSKTDSRVRVIRSPQNVNSVAISLGKCLLDSNPDSEFVSWMFDDCILLPGALSKLARRIEQQPVDVLFGVTNVKLKSGGILTVGSIPPDDIKRDIAASPVLVPNAGILVRRRVFDQVGWYDPSIVLRRSCDWDLFRRILASGATLETIPDVLVEEYGETQPDSLRNSFTTTFDIMRRYAKARDAMGLSLNVKSCLCLPVDWIPPADWSSAELSLMQYMFLEYFLSVANVPRALRWAKQLEPALEKPSLSLINLRLAAEQNDGQRALMSAGAYCGLLSGLYKQTVLGRS